MTRAAALLVGALWIAAQPATDLDWRPVADGVEHAHVVRDAPWDIHLLRVDPARVRLDVRHARDNAVGLETVSAMAARTGAIAAINGGYFRMTGTFGGDSTGTLQIDGRLLSEPDRGRAAVGFVRARGGTRLIMGHVAWEGLVRAGRARRVLDGINRPRGGNELVLFTPEFRDTTLTDATGTEVVIRNGRVADIRDESGSTAIPSNGFVLSATGAVRAWVKEALGPGTRVSVRMKLKPAGSARDNPWPKAEDVLGAGPKLVTAGRVDITADREKMAPAFSTDRHPRTAIASLPDGRVLLAVVDGRQALSVGMTLDELARLLVDFGAIEAINLDGGGSTTMVVQGAVVNQPSDATGERPVSDAILVLPGGSRR